MAKASRVQVNVLLINANLSTGIHELFSQMNHHHRPSIYRTYLFAGPSPKLEGP